MSLTGLHIAEIRQILSAEETINQSSPAYKIETKVWAQQKNLHPKLALRPQSVPALQNILAYLGKSGLDFAVRGGGAGSSSAKDVVLSMTAFDELKFDAVSETIVVGAGKTWGEVDREMEEVAPGYAVVGSRVPYTGVAGTILSGGISWLSHEHGLSSDPQNLLDAHVVLLDGRELWASEEPDLLWALRGGGGNFGVVTAFKMKAHQYPSTLYAGMIALPYSSLEVLSKGASTFAGRHDPKVAMHIFVLDGEGGALKGKSAKASLSLLVFDADGEEHGRSEAGFKWALDIEGAVDMTKGNLSIREVNNLQAGTESFMGMLNSNLSAALVEEIDPQFVVRGVRWFEKLVQIDSNLGAGTFVLIEVMQKGAFNAAEATGKTAWPRSSQLHILQLVVGHLPGTSPTDEVALDLLEKGPSEIARSHEAGSYTPNFIESFHDLSKIFGLNYQRLQELKARYDPRGRLDKRVLI